MATKPENTAPEPAMQTAERLIRYQTLLALLDTLYECGEINKETCTTAGKLMAMKCGLKQDSIFIESGLADCPKTTKGNENRAKIWYNKTIKEIDWVCKKWGTFREQIAIR